MYGLPYGWSMYGGALSDPGPASGSPTISVPVTFSVLTGITYIPRTTSVTVVYVLSGG